jgi:AcrR family transcriptional regulator
MVDVPTRDRRAERHAATRAEILEAAWAQVRAEGIAALSLRDLATAVGLRAPSLYSYFDSKHAIYDAMFAGAAQAFLDTQARVGVGDGDGLADLKAGARSFVAFCTADPARYQLLFQRTIPGFEPSAASYAIAVEALDLARERLAGAGVDRPADLDLFTAITSGLADQQIANDPGGDRWLRLVDEAMEMFFHHVTNRSGAGTPRRKR